MVVGDIARAWHDGLMEAVNCIGNDVACHKEMRECLGGCGGSDGSNLKHDFHTQVSLADLGEVILGEEGFSQAAANCTIKTAMVDVPLFEGGAQRTLIFEPTLAPTLQQLETCCSRNARP